MFKLKEVICGNKIKVEPGWFWEGYTGDQIWIEGFVAPQLHGSSGYEFAKKKIEMILDKQEFKLYAPKFYEKYGKTILCCRVYLDLTDISFLFPEFGGRRIN